MNGRHAGLFVLVAAFASFSDAQPAPQALTNSYTLDALRQQAAERGVTLEAYATLVGTPVVESLSDTNSAVYIEQMRLTSVAESDVHAANMELVIEPEPVADRTGTNALEYLAQRQESARQGVAQAGEQANLGEFDRIEYLADGVAADVTPVSEHKRIVTRREFTSSDLNLSDAEPSLPRESGGFAEKESSRGFIELGSGLQYQDDSGIWRQSRVEPETLPDGGVAFTRMPTMRFFAPHAGERVVVRSKRRDGPEALSAMGGLSYYDRQSGKTVLIAWITNAPVTAYDGGVYYADAFIGVDADLVYKVHPWGMEQDVVIYGGLPDPALFGMDPEHTRLCALTELVDIDMAQTGIDRVGDVLPAEPANAPIKVSIKTDELRWHTIYDLIQGYAYPEEGEIALGGHVTSTERHRVAMRIFSANGRIFLSEEVEFPKVRASAPAIISSQYAVELPFDVAQERYPVAIPLERPQLADQQPSISAPAEHASYQPRGETRYVLDYVSLSGSVSTGLTFRSGQTYYISGPLTIGGGTLIIESGAIVKLATNAYVAANYPATLDTRSMISAPAIFTSAMDTNVGEVVLSGQHPSSNRYQYGLSINAATVHLSGVSFRYAKVGIDCEPWWTNQFRDLEFLNCDKALNVWGEGGPLWIKNMLVENATNAIYVDDGTRLELANCTFRDVSGIAVRPNVAGLRLADTLFYNVHHSIFSNSSITSIVVFGSAAYNVTTGWLGASVVTLGSNTFEVGLFGSSYLNQASPAVNAGSTNASAAGLYHYTTATNQLKETNSTVDIGFHYGTTNDLDADGLPDYVEDTNANGSYDAGDYSDLGDEDSDNDGLLDGEEYLLGTGPLDDDTDGDGANDGLEVAQGTDPLNAASFPATVSGTVTYSGSQTGQIHIIAQSYGVVTSPAAFHMDFNSATNTLRDNSAWQTPATALGATWQSTGGLASSGGYYFDGNGPISLGDFPQVEGAYNLTFGGWVRPEPGIWLGGLMGKTYYGDESIMLLIPEETNAEVYVMQQSQTSWTVARTNGVITNHYAWHHMMAVYTGTNALLYINGELATVSPAVSLQPVRSNGVTATLGDAGGDMWWTLYGHLDEMRVHRAVLSPAEIHGLYLGGLDAGAKRSVTNATTGAYAIANVPNGTNYWVWAWRDANGNGVRDYYEPVGFHPGNSLSVTDDVSGVDIQLTDPDSDGDGASDWLELQVGTSPTDPTSYPCNISGRLSYTGGQTGLFRVIAVATQTFVTTLSSTGDVYVISNAPNKRAYTVTAYRDSDGDQTNDAPEAYGAYTNNPFVLSNTVTNININLVDPDTDLDGMPDWWEILHGFNPTSPVPGQGEGWWKFDETSGTNAANSAGTGYDGQLVNMPTNAWTEGRLGGSLLFDGTNDYVRIPQSPAIITGQQFTISAWAWLDPTFGDEYPTIISDFNACGSGYQGYWMAYDSYVAGPAMLAGTCSGYMYPYSTAAITGRWVHIAGTYDGTAAHFYLDGVEIASSADSFMVATQSEIRIGWSHDPSFTYHWKGRLDDVRVYKSRLSSNTVATLYDALADSDEDGLDNLTEYLQGRNPNAGAIADTNEVAGLTVFTPMESRE